MAHVYLARQPVFDRKLEVYGYELLYRSSAVGGFNGADGAAASLQVLSSGLLGFGLDELLNGRWGFVNFPRELLVSDVVRLMPPTSMVIEILETVEPDDLVAASCRKLKEMGFLLALDDIVPDAPTLKLAHLADILKVDYPSTTAEGRRLLMQRYASNGRRMLAEKVETREEFGAALSEGFDLFQGYFFTRPVILSRKEAPAFKLNYLQLLSNMQYPEIEFDQVECLIRREASLCQRLLRYANSAAFSSRRRAATIREALVRLGEKELRRWVALAALPALASDQPDELVASAVLRGRFCESIAARVGIAERSGELFLMGVFSLLDVMVGQPLDEALAGLSLADDVREALAGAGEGVVSEIHKLGLACERGNWNEVGSVARNLGLEVGAAAKIYLEAVRGSGEVFVQRAAMASQDHRTRRP